VIGLVALALIVGVLIGSLATQRRYRQTLRRLPQMIEVRKTRASD
jgi:uncharacterized protein YneF (UPF0154 family)